VLVRQDILALSVDTSLFS